MRQIKTFNSKELMEEWIKLFEKSKKKGEKIIDIDIKTITETYPFTYDFDRHCGGCGVGQESKTRYLYVIKYESSELNKRLYRENDYGFSHSL